MTIASHIVQATRAGTDLTAIEFNGLELSWSALSAGIGSLDSVLTSVGLNQDSLVGLLGRNRLEQLGGFVSILGAGRGLVLVNAIRPSSLVAQEVLDLRLACLMGSEEDLTSEIVRAAERGGTLVLQVSIKAGQLTFRTIGNLGIGPFRPRQPGTLIEIQTSGTTGVPKRIGVMERTVEASLRDGVRGASGPIDQSQLTPKTSPTLMFGPLVHTSGTFNTLMSVFEVRPIVLFEKFDADGYRQALRRYRPKFAPLPPAAIKMLVDSAATKEDFASVLAVRVGTAPLPVELQLAFEAKFGVPVLTTYGATEFMGVVTSWTLDDHRQFSTSKRGSVGRASQGVQLQIVDPLNGEPLPAGEQGLLEAKLERIDGAKEWMRTSDLAKIDADGFLFILGRADDAINRGGFKVMAGKVADILREHPGVDDVIVIGRPDARLGEVPVAVIESKRNAPAIDPGELRAFAKQRLAAYEVPARFHLVESLPRTISDKISRPEVKWMLDRLGDSSAP